MVALQKLWICLQSFKGIGTGAALQEETLALSVLSGVWVAHIQ